MSDRQEAQGSNLETINEMIVTSKEVIETIKRSMCFSHPRDHITACKSITRLTEDIRRLVRLKIKLEEVK